MSPTAAPAARSKRAARPRTAPRPERAYLDKRDLTALIPLSLATLHRLEARGEFPRRFVLSPTKRVCWRRREVERWIEQRRTKRVTAA